MIRARENKIYNFFYSVVSSIAFKILSLLAIISNVIVLGMVSDNASPQYEDTLEKLNMFFFSFFVFELVSKLIG